MTDYRDPISSSRATWNTKRDRIIQESAMLSRELVDLVGDSAYSNLFLDTHDRGLLGYILDTCINEKAVTTNRYRFSNIPTDFFVPNKTLYKDYIEFIKGLPLKSDYEALDLEYSCQILSDKLRGKYNFNLITLFRYVHYIVGIYVFNF